MYLRNSITLSVAAYMAVVLSGCGGSNDSKPAVTNNSQSSAVTSSSVASTASSMASVASSTSSAAASVTSSVTSSTTSSAASSAPVAVIQDTTLVLPSSLEVVTNEAAK